MGKAGQGRHRWRPALMFFAVFALCALALAWLPGMSLASTTPVYSAQQVQRGARLAAIGSCAACHTSDAAAPYAGGVPLHTPFGVVYSTNITPDTETGIGGWSRDEFTRAMREGVSRDGHQLYPAFPYDFYTRLTDDDIASLYAFIMTRDPIRAPARENRMRFPFGFRPLVAGWKLLYLDKSPVVAKADKDPAWNRGAYLVEALGHCGACHTPRNALGAPERRRYLGGGEAEGWYAPPLDKSSPSPLPWTVEQLTAYLRAGIAEDHAVAGGPMQQVASALADADENDVRAMAVYIHSFMGTPSSETQQNALAGAKRASHESLPAPSPDDRVLALGYSVYQGACARCHDRGRVASSSGALQLPAAVAVYDPDPRSLIHVIRDGIIPPDTEPGRWMPGFANALTDEQVAALAAYLRRYAARMPPWPKLDDAVQKAKSP